MTFQHWRFYVLVGLVSIPSLFFSSRASANPGATFVETMGNVAGTTSIAAHEASDGFANDAFTMTGTGDVRSTQPSTGYAGASGQANIFLSNDTGTRDFQIEGVNASGFTSLQVNFGVFKSTLASDGSDLVVEVSADGTNYTALSFPALPTGSGTVIWFLRTATGAIPSAADLRIRFTNTGVSTAQYRIDDVQLVAADAAAALDNAADVAYADGWATGDNGGGGLQPWTLGVTTTNISEAGQFIGSSAANGGGDTAPPIGDIDTSGVAWGLYANSGQTSDAVRPFLGTLGLGQAFLIALDNGFIDAGGTVGLGLQDLGGNDRLEFLFVGGSPAYTIQTSASTDTGIGFTDQGLNLLFTLTGTNTGALAVTPLGGTRSVFTNLTLGGVSGAGIVQARLFNANAGPGIDHNFFGNSIVICTNFPATTASNNGPICEGQTLTLSATGSGSDTYNWTGPNGFSSTSQNPSIAGATTNASGTYIVTRTASSCPQPSLPSSTTATVTAAPTCTVDPASAATCVGQAQTFTANAAGGTPPYSFTWTGPEQNGATNQSITVSTAGTYTCTIQDSNLCPAAGAQCSAMLSVSAGPACSITAPSVVCANAISTFSGPAGLDSYSWGLPATNNLSGAFFIGATDGQTVDVNAGTNTTGFRLTLDVTSAGCSNSCLRNVSVSSPAAPTASNSSPVCPGQSVQLFASGAGSFQWTGPNNFNSMLQNPIITNVQTNDAGLYCVTVASAGCTSGSNCTTVALMDPPSVTISNNAPICSGQTLKLFAVGSLADSYSWTGPSSFTSTIRNPTIPNAQVSNSGTYTVVATLRGCPSDPAESVVEIIEQPVCSITGANAVCALAIEQFCGPSGDGFTYKWRISGDGVLIGSTTRRCIDVFVAKPLLVPGSFSLSLTVSNGICGDKCSTDITVNDSPVLLTTLLPNGAVGVDYNQALLVTNGAPPYTFAVFPDPPVPGLSLDPVTGVISGTPTTTGAFAFCITVTDANGCTDSGEFEAQCYTVSISECTPFVMLPQTLPDAFLDTAYNQVITVQGGVPPVNFIRTAGQLPPGLFLDNDGTVFGVPTTNTVTSFEVTCVDAVGCTGQRSYTLRTTCPPIILFPGPDELPIGEKDSPYGPEQLIPIGGTGPYTFAQTGGSLPAGLSLDADTGEISGIPTSDSGSAFTVTVTDANGCRGTQTYTLIIAIPPPSLPPVPRPLAGVSFDEQITPTGGEAPFSFAVTSGALPPGITLSGSGRLSGTATAIGSYSVTIQVTDAGGRTGSRDYDMTVSCPTVSVSPAGLIGGTTGIFYSQILSASGGASPHSLAVTSGALPAGLSLTPSGVLSGTPTVAGQFTFEVRATNGNGCNGSRAYTVTVTCPTVSVGPTTLANATAGIGYNQSLSGAGGHGPYAFALAAGSLPSGLSLSNNGVLSGTTTATGEYVFTIRAADANGCAASRSYAVTVSCAAVNVSPTALVAGTVGTDYQQTLSATGAPAPHSFAVTAGALPAGLTLNSDGELSGTPTATGQSSFTIAATNAGGCTGSRTFAVSVSCPTVSVVPAVLSDAILGADYGETVAANGGSAPHAFAVFAGALPVGMSLSADGVLSGTPTVAGVYDFEISATDAHGCAASRAFRVRVDCPGLSLSPSVLGSGAVGVSYQQSLSAAGGRGPHSFAVVSGALPPGLALSATGSISGTPAAASDYIFEIRVADADGCSAGRSFTVHIETPTAKSVVVTESDGDTATASLAGAGAVVVQPAGGGARIHLVGTDATSSFTLKVARKQAGDGRMKIDGIIADGGLKSINAAGADLVGAGIELGGGLGSLKIGAIRDSRVVVAGSIGALRAAEVRGSLIAAGFAPSDAAEPMAGGTFAAGSLIKSVTIGSFANSVIAAGQVGKVKLANVTTQNGGRAFGVLAQQSIAAVSIGKPRFKWNAAGPANQAVDDFHVQH